MLDTSKITLVCFFLMDYILLVNRKLRKPQVEMVEGFKYSWMVMEKVDKRNAVGV